MTARHYYTLLLYLITPLILLRLCWRGLRNHAYWQRWAERFGFIRPKFSRQPKSMHQPIWIHAVSVGEVQAAVPLIHSLQRDYPGRSLVITTMTPTGSQRVQELFGGQVFHVYLPYDYPGAVRRFLNQVRPQLALIMETELWPNLFHQIAQRHIPAIVANARLSPRSARGYQRLRRLVKSTLADITLIAAQTTDDADRFIALGAASDKVTVMGNIKYDQPLPDDIHHRAQTLRAQWGEARPVWVAASTHEGEEEAVLNVQHQLREKIPGVLLVLAPRHPERFARVASKAEARGFNVVRRSEPVTTTTNADIYILDSLGELLPYYAAANVAFIGGSLIPVGGHNMLEAAGLQTPVVFGPHLFNFKEISTALLDSGAARKVEDAAQLVTTLTEILQDSELQRHMGEAGQQMVMENRGAMQRLLEKVSPWLRQD